MKTEDLKRANEIASFVKMITEKKEKIEKVKTMIEVNGYRGTISFYYNGTTYCFSDQLTTELQDKVQEKFIDFLECLERSFNKEIKLFEKEFDKL